MLQRLERVLKRLFGLAVAVNDKIIDPWQEMDTSYVGQFRKQLDEIAGMLSSGNRQVHTRFNRSLECAELYVPLGETLVQVVVHGEMCSPEKAIVRPLALPEGGRELFIKMFPLPVEFNMAV